MAYLQAWRGKSSSPMNFRAWWDALSEEQQDDVAHSIRHLIEFGPALGFPHSSKVGSSRYPQMRELRTRERWEAAANALRIQPAPLGHPLDRGREDRRRPLEWVVGYFGSFKDILIQSDPDDSSQHS